VDTRPACRNCGHGVEWHEHYRAGSDCGCCVTCRSYSPPRVPLRDWLRRARAALALWRTRRR